MAVRWLSLLLVGCSLACGTKDSEGGRDNCDAYLDCLAETDPEAFENEINIYGRQGSCFDNASNDDCQTACLGKLEALGENSEACEPPPEPEPEPGNNPTPDADGYVDCALIRGGNTVGPGEPGPLGFPELACSPRASGASEFSCCSDDPAAVGGLPEYTGGSSGGTPIFSGSNNGVGTSGMCIRLDDLPAGAGLPEAGNCPVPCNPTWSDVEVETVCGGERRCCQTRQLQPEDCIQDDDGTWRPVTGADILEATSNWAPDRHRTHQDPGGLGCASFAGSSDVDDPAFVECLEQLTVADQRGFCQALQPGQACPADVEGYMNTCEQINAGLIPPP